MLPKSNIWATERNLKLKKNYGITLKDYNELLQQQNNACAICAKPETATIKDKLVDLSVDHNHKTKKVRGLLCQRCNRGLGFLQDSKEIVEAAINYIRTANARKQHAFQI